LFDLGVLEESGPEVGNSRGVVDFENVELLGHLAIEFELLSLEGGDDLLSEVNSDEIFQLTHLYDFTLGGFDSLSEVSSVSLVLEESSHSSLSSVEVV
jgi:hypothetical protein